MAFKRAAGAPGWCTRQSPPTSTSSTAARPTSPGRRSWSRRRPSCSSNAACGASTSMPTPSTRRPKWPASERKRERNYDRHPRRTFGNRHRGRPRHRPGHRRSAGCRGRQRDRGRCRRLDRRRGRRPSAGARGRREDRQEGDRLRRKRRLTRRRQAARRDGGQELRRHRHRGEQRGDPARRLRLPHGSARLGRGDPQQPVGGVLPDQCRLGGDARPGQVGPRRRDLRLGPHRQHRLVGRPLRQSRPVGLCQRQGRPVRADARGGDGSGARARSR